MSATIELVRASRWYGPVIALNDVTVSVPAPPIATTYPGLVVVRPPTPVTVSA